MRQEAESMSSNAYLDQKLSPEQRADVLLKLADPARAGLLLPDLEGVDTVEEQIDIARRKGGIDPYEDYKLQRFEVVRYT